MDPAVVLQGLSLAPPGCCLPLESQSPEDAGIAAPSAPKAAPGTARAVSSDTSTDWDSTWITGALLGVKQPRLSRKHRKTAAVPTNPWTTSTAPSVRHCQGLRRIFPQRKSLRPPLVPLSASYDSLILGPKALQAQGMEVPLFAVSMGVSSFRATLQAKFPHHVAKNTLECVSLM